jgi:hypothetical protein
MAFKRQYILFIAYLFANSILLGAQDKGVPKTTTDSTACGRNAGTAYAICRGPWSGKTISLFNTWTAFDSNPDRRLRLPSPDNTKVLVVNGFHLRLLVDGRSLWTPFGNMHDAEIAWSPDSKRLFVTWSETGELGTWHLQVYAVDDSGLREFRGVETIARRDFEKRVRLFPIPKEFRSEEGRQYWSGEEYCEPYHVIGSQWLNGSEELLISVLVRNTGNCRYSSAFDSYRIKSTTGEILQRLTAREAHAKYGDYDLPISSK